MNKIKGFIYNNWKTIFISVPGIIACLTLAVQYFQYRHQTSSAPHIYIEPLQYEILPIALAKSLTSKLKAFSTTEKLLEQANKTFSGISDLHKKQIIEILSDIQSRSKKEYEDAITPYIQPLKTRIHFYNTGKKAYVIKKLRLFSIAISKYDSKEAEEIANLGLSPAPPYKVSPNKEAIILIEFPLDSKIFIEEQVKSFPYSSTSYGMLLGRFQIKATLLDDSIISRSFYLMVPSFRKGEAKEHASSVIYDLFK